MAVTAADLTSPAGLLDPAILFPGESLLAFEERLDAYIAQGVSEADALTGAEKDVAVTRWAYYRAYDAVYQRFAAQATTQTLADQGSISYAAGQASHFLALANGYRAEFEAALDTTELTPEVPVSRARPITYSW